jgi:hypothetical protein
VCNFIHEQTYGRCVAIVGPRVIGNVDDEGSRPVLGVTTKDRWTLVETAIDESVGTRDLGHADGDILRLGENFRSLESLPEGSTVRPRIGGIGGRIEGDDGVDVTVGDEKGFDGDVLVGQASIDEGDVREVRDLDQSAGVLRAW